MKLFLEINLVLSALLVNVLLVIIKKQVMKSNFEFRWLFFHSGCISEFKKLISDEADPLKRQAYEKQLFLFKVSLCYLISTILVFAIILAVGA
jgi:hypothetical protein